MNPEDPLIELIFERLVAAGLPSETSDLVLAALTGDRDLAAALAGHPTSLASTNSSTAGPTAQVYLSSVTVAGFRGVGPQRTLTIPAGHGLTLVVGRNGSGKSSFAEAAELALTGDSARWADKNSVWRTGWRNLHVPDPCAISVELRIDGRAEPLHVQRGWPAGSDLAAAKVTIAGGTAVDDLDALGLTRPLRLYRPFLTAAELGGLVAGTPSKLFDALNAILGLEALTDADKRLRDAARPLDTTIKEVRAHRATLRDTLADVDDDRARRAAEVLGAATSDLDRLDAILAEPADVAGDATVVAYRKLADLPLPDQSEVTELGEQLRAAAEEARRHDAAATRASMATAELLRVALDYHTDAGDGPCPVCRTGTLDNEWRANAATSLDELRQRTGEAQRAASGLRDLVRRTRTLIATVTSVDSVPADTPAIATAMATLGTAATVLREAPADPEALAAHLVAHFPGVTNAVDAVRAEAAAWLRERDSGWQRAAAEVRSWLDAARRLPGQQQTLTRLKAARAWLTNAGVEIRNDRLAPFATHSQQIWQELRQESNVTLGAMTLAGTTTRRRVEFPVHVDGADNGYALGVMSQGEMHALGLATFLPRSCAKESPFRFVVIDDPVQSMDPSKVDGLARVLGGLAEERQVIVFTHDNRLPDAVRNLDIDANVVEVVRAEQSVVTLRPALDPVARYLDDARAVARSTDVPADVRAPVVAELCRSALEAACHQVIWRARLRRGVRHDDIEAAIEQARRLPVTFALALFDDAERGADVLGFLNRRHGPWAADTYQACRQGVHGAYLQDLPRLVDDTRRLAKALT